MGRMALVAVCAALGVPMSAGGQATEAANDHRPVLSPDGRTLAFMSDREGTWAVYVMEMESGMPARRISADPHGEWYPDWSPDGTRLAYHRQPSTGSDLPRQVFVLDVATGEERQLTRGAAHNAYARWSPDGEHLLFWSDRDGNLELYEMAPDGSGQRRLTRSEADDHDPALSPDGRWLAFVSRPPGGANEIHVARADGSHPRRLTDHGANTYGIDWSPDGRRIAYNTDVDGDQELHVLDVETGTSTRLTHSPGTDHLPRWIEGGRRLIFTSERSGAERIYTVRGDGSDVRLLETLRPGT